MLCSFIRIARKSLLASILHIGGGGLGGEGGLWPTPPPSTSQQTDLLDNSSFISLFYVAVSVMCIEEAAVLTVAVDKVCVWRVRQFTNLQILSCLYCSNITSNLRRIFANVLKVTMIHDSIIVVFMCSCVYAIINIGVKSGAKVFSLWKFHHYQLYNIMCTESWSCARQQYYLSPFFVMAMHIMKFHIATCTCIIL